MTKKTDIPVDPASLKRRLQFEGDVRYLANRMLARLQSIGWPVGRWSAVFSRVAARFSIVVFDLLECVKRKSRIRSIGEPRRVVIHTASKLSQHPRFLGYWHDPSRHSMVAMHLGVDLIRHEGCYYVNELNLDAALRPERRALYEEETDPVLTGILREAKAQQFGRVILCSGRWRASYRAETERAGRQYELDLEMASTRTWRDSASLPLPGLPVPLEEDTLYVIFSGRHTPIDYLIHDKLGSASWLPYIANDLSPEDRLIAGIPTSDTPVAPTVDPAAPWPNLVAKLAGWDMGRFVLFAKVRDENEARGTLGLNRDGDIPDAFRQSVTEKAATRLLRKGPVIYQAYMAPEVTEAGYLRTYRLHLFVSPIANRYLSAHGITSACKIPSQLPFGIVDDPGPYITSFAQGASYTRLDERTDREIGRAASQIGLSLQRILTRKFQTSPG